MALYISQKYRVIDYTEKILPVNSQKKVYVEFWKLGLWMFVVGYILLKVHVG